MDQDVFNRLYDDRERLIREMVQLKKEFKKVVDDMCESICAETDCYLNPINPEYTKPEKGGE